MSTPPPPSHPKVVDDDDGFGLDRKLAAASVQFIDRLLRLCNFLNAALLCVAGILAIILESFNIPLFLVAVYVVIFSCCLMGFELRWKKFERLMFANMGFIFNWFGRVLFFAFIGTLAIGFGTVLGYVAASLTGVNLLWNYYCMRVHKEYRKWVNDDNAVRRARAHYKADQTAAEILQRRQSEADPNYKPKNDIPQIKVQVPGPAGTTMNVAVPMQASVAVERPPTKDDWEKLYDEATKQFYYHNHATGETRWDVPT